MGRGTTTFTLLLSKTPEEANSIIQQFLSINKFTLETDSLGQYYHFYDPALIGHRGFCYQIYNDKIIITVWTGKRGKEYALTGIQGFAVNAQYLELLKSLEIALTGTSQYISSGSKATQQDPVNKISNLQATNAQAFSQAPNPQSGYYQQPQQVQNQSVDAMQDAANASAEKFCIISFVLSILTSVLSLCGVAFGIPLIVIEFFGAIKGLKTRKRGLAIAALVLASISSVVLLIYIISRLVNGY